MKGDKQKLTDKDVFIQKDVGPRFDIAPDPKQKKAGKKRGGHGQGGKGN